MLFSIYSDSVKWTTWSEAVAKAAGGTAEDGPRAAEAEAESVTDGASSGKRPKPAKWGNLTQTQRRNWRKRGGEWCRALGTRKGPRGFRHGISPNRKPGGWQMGNVVPEAVAKAAGGTAED